MQSSSSARRWPPRRTLIIWLVLVIGFVIIYSLFTPDHAPGTPPPPRSSQSMTWWWYVALAVPVLAIGTTWWRVRRLRARMAPPLRDLADGRVERAASALRRIAARDRANAAAVRLPLGIALLRQGELTAAIDTLAVESPQLPAPFRGPSVAAPTMYLGWAHALAGDANRAAACCADGERRLTGAVDRPAAEAILVLTRMTLAARAGDGPGAARSFDEHAARLEGTLSVSLMKAAWALRGFAAAQSAGPRDAGAAAEPWLRRIAGARPDEVDFLATAWPELRAFLATAR